MAKAPADLSKMEWTLMESLWARRRGTATELQRDLQDTTGWAYSTVKTMLDRLVEKGAVKARRVGNVYEYSARVKRPSVVARVLDDVFDRVLAGSLAPFVDRLIDHRRLSPEQIDDLRALLDRYEDEERRQSTPQEDSPRG